MFIKTLIPKKHKIILSNNIIKRFRLQVFITLSLKLVSFFFFLEV